MDPIVSIASPCGNNGKDRSVQSVHNTRGLWYDIMIMWRRRWISTDVLLLSKIKCSTYDWQCATVNTTVGEINKVPPQA
jgi:hypothetical protein